MLKILLIILALAAYGASALMDKFSAPAEEAPASASVADSKSTSLASSLGSMAVSAVTSASGIDVAAMPLDGCARGALSQESIEELFDTLPEGQADMLRQMLASTGATNLTMEWYSGELGTGVCIPAKELVFLFPSAITQTLSSLTDASSVE